MKLARKVARGALIGLAVVLGACSGDEVSVAGDGGADVALGTAVDVPDAGECVLVTQQSVGGACVVEWSCREHGVLILGCGETDGGVSCRCELEDGAGTGAAGSPTSCTPDDATAFARTACAWSWL